MPLEIINSKPIGDTINFYITYFGNYSLYELPYYESWKIGEKPASFSTKFEYFLFDSQKDSGFFLTSFNDSLTKKVRKDSLLKLRAYNGGDGNSINIIDQEIKSISQIYDFNGIQTYRLISKDTKTADSMYMMFDKSMKDIKFSWSKKLDSVYNSKFCQFIIFLKHDLIRNTDSLRKDFYTTRLEIFREKIQHEREIINLFSRFDNIKNKL